MYCNSKFLFSSILLVATFLFAQVSPLSAQSKSDVQQEREAAKIQQKIERDGPR